MLRAITANLPDPLYVKDREGRFLIANQGTAENNGATSIKDLIGKTDFDFFPRELAQGFWEDEQKVIEEGQPQISKEECITEFGRKTRWMLSTKVPLCDPSGQIIGMIGVGRNISALKEVEAELKIARDELAFKASHDSLTSLLSRGAILEMLSRELTRNARENGCSTVLLGDLDLFKEINDIHGHPVGDEVLREVSLRLLKAVRSYDLVGRFGGEEFLIVLPGCAAADAPSRAEQLRQAIACSPVPTSRGPISITISLGVLFLEEWRQPTSEEVLREVDTALYASKAAGRNCCSVAHPPAGRAALVQS
jgi:diguanylate cyclase (GGDEF)-like protein/PAS domain S-box-containing protein